LFVFRWRFPFWRLFVFPCRPARRRRAPSQAFPSLAVFLENCFPLCAQALYEQIPRVISLLLCSPSPCLDLIWRSFFSHSPAFLSSLVARRRSSLVGSGTDASDNGESESESESGGEEEEEEEEGLPSA
jgi:hypothetical protein